MATTTKFWTWTQIYSKMTAELDLEGGDDDFVSESEMMAYANDAIDEAEGEPAPALPKPEAPADLPGILQR